LNQAGGHGQAALRAFSIMRSAVAVSFTPSSL
jgi:hypothetical protein